MNPARCRYLPKAVIASAMLLACAAQAAEMTLYLQPNFNGRQVTLRGFTPNLGSIGFQDQVSSMVVQSGRWEVCTQPDFKGDCVTVSPGEYAALDPRLNHRIESAREVGAYRDQTGSYNAYGRGSIELFGQPGMRGKSMKIDRDAPSLAGSGFDDRASSLVVTNGTWQLCTDPGYAGNCRIFTPGSYSDLGYGMAKEVSSARLVRANRDAPAVFGGGFEAPAAPVRDARVILFEGGDLRGESIAVAGPNSALSRSGFDDAATSMIVEGGRWLFCTEPYFRGECTVLGPGRYRSLREYGLDRNISSLRPAGGPEAPASPAAPRPMPAGDIELYADADFAGGTYATRRDISNLGPTDFNDRASSAIVYAGQWEMCTDGEYGGRCAVFGPGRYPNLGGLSEKISSLRRIR